MIEQMIYDFKFERRGSMASPLAELLSDAIGILPEGVTIVPIPTISSHIRQRGYDHTLLLARHLAKLQNCSFEQLLTRKTSSRQRGAPRAQRIRQANEAFMASSHLDNSRTYLLLDDVTTTGATLAAAARELRNSGAHTVWTACIAYQAMSGGDEQSAGFHK